MLPDDAFGAAKIVAQFSDEAVRAIVHVGDYLDPEAEQFLADTIIARRDKVVAHYFTESNPLDSFRIVGSNLEFSNLGQEHGLATARAYEYEWFRFGNETMELTPLAGHIGEVEQPSLPIPVSEEGDVPAAVEFGRVAAAPVNTLRQQTHRCQEISVCF